MTKLRERLRDRSPDPSRPSGPDPDERDAATSEAAVVALLDRLRWRRWRRALRHGLARALAAAGVVATLAALGALFGLSSLAAAGWTTLVGGLLSLALFLAPRLRPPSRAATARWLDRRAEQRDLFGTVVEEIEGANRVAPEWRPLLYRRAAARTASLEEGVAPEPVDEHRRLLAVAAVVAATAAWSAVGVWGPRSFEPPVTLVEYVRDRSLDDLPDDRAGSMVRAGEPILEEELPELPVGAEDDPRERADGLEPHARAGESGEPASGGSERRGESEGSLGEQEQESDTAQATSPAEASTSEVGAEDVVEERRQSLDRRQEDSSEPAAASARADRPRPEDAKAKGRSDDGEGGEDDAGADGEPSSRQSSSESAGGRQDARQSAEGAGAPQSVSAGDESEPGEADGTAAGDGTGPQAGRAELFGATAPMPLEAVIALEAERHEATVESFETRENEERELASRAQSAEAPYRDVTLRESAVPAIAPSESEPIPWRHRSTVRRYFRPDPPADEGDPP